MPTYNFRPIEQQDELDRIKQKATLASSGSINRKPTDLVFNTAVGNEYKMADSNQFTNLDGNVVDTYGLPIVSGLYTLGTSWSEEVPGTLVSTGGNGTNAKSTAILTGLDSATVEFSCTIESGSFYVDYYNGTSHVLVETISHSGKHSVELPAGASSNGSVYFYSTLFNGSITDISVREITTITIPKVTVKEVVGKGDELVTNGTFDTDTGWTKQASWSIGAGVATSSGVNGERINQANVILPDTKYLIKFDILGYTSGSLGIEQYDGTYNEIASVSSGNGSYSFGFTSSSTANGTILFNSKSFIGSIDNISVKEILPMETTQETLAGEFVVYDKEELVTNGYTDSSAGSVGITIEADGSVTAVSAQENAAFDIPTIVGEVYTYSVDVGYTSGDMYMFTTGTDNGGNDYSIVGASGRYTMTFTAIDTTTSVAVRFRPSSPFTGTVSSPSVTVVSDIYRATVDSADMYDYEYIVGNTYTIYPDDIVKPIGFTAHTSGEVFKYVGASGVKIPLSTWDLVASADYELLGTATNMSLLNPYFQDRTQYGVTNTQLITRKSDGTIKTEVCFVDIPTNVADNADEVMTLQGYSIVGDGWYSKGTDLVTSIGTVVQLNDGAFHPVYNYFGTKGLRDTVTSTYTQPWYQSTAYRVVSSADTFLYSDDLDGTRDTGTILDGTSRHPQGKFYDIIYKNQFIDLRLDAEGLDANNDLASNTSKLSSNGLDGVGCVVATYGYIPNLTVSLVGIASTGYAYAKLDTINFSAEPFNQIIGKASYLTGTIINNTTGAVFATDIQYAGTTSTVDIYYGKKATGDFTIGDDVSIIFYKQLPINHSGEILSTDVIGDPANYPAEWKARLASGLPLIGLNPALVKRDGTSNIPVDATTPTLEIQNKSVVGNANVVRQNDGLTTFGSATAPIDNINNNLPTNFIDYDLYIVNYTAKIPTTKIDTPKQVVMADNKVTATNSHSIYKGNQAIPTDIQVGNGFESRGLENAEIANTKELDGATAVTLITNDLVVVASPSVNGVLGATYEYIGTGFTGVVTDVTNTSFWALLGANIATTPQHNTINLDNSASSAVKYFTALTKDDNDMAYLTAFSEEMVWDFDRDAIGNFTAVSGSVDTAFTDGTMYYVTAGLYDNYVMKALFSATTRVDHMYMLSGGKYLIDSNGVKKFEIWDGLGFGDNNKFNQLTNGTRTDLNGNTISTAVSSICLNKKVK